MGGPGSSRRVKLLGVAAAILVGVSTLTATNILNLPFIRLQAEVEQEAEEEIDNKKPALEWHVDYSTTEGSGLEWELDRALTAQEEVELAATKGDSKKVWEFFKKRGGRKVGDFETQVKIQFLSDRSDPVTITKLTAKPIRCWVSQAKTVAYTSLGGPEAWEEVLFAFHGAADENGEFPAVDVQLAAEQAGERKLWDKPIVVGGGETPGYVKMAVESEKSCEWVLKVRYNVGVGASRTATVRDGAENFAVRVSSSEAEGAWLVADGATVKSSQQG